MAFKIDFVSLIFVKNQAGKSTLFQLDCWFLLLVFVIYVSFYMPYAIVCITVLKTIIWGPVDEPHISAAPLRHASLAADDGEVKDRQ